jgi:hypothetical protein
MPGSVSEPIIAIFSRNLKEVNGDNTVFHLEGDCIFHILVADVAVILALLKRLRACLEFNRVQGQAGPPEGQKNSL